MTKKDLQELRDILIDATPGLGLSSAVMSDSAIAIRNYNKRLIETVTERISNKTRTHPSKRAKKTPKKVGGVLKKNHKSTSK